MKRKILYIFMLIAAFVISGLGSCVSSSSKNKKVDFQNSRDSIDWAGVYKGKIPLENGSAMSVRLKLYRDQSFDIRFEYLDKSYETINWMGSFQWDDTGNIIILDISDMPLYYKVTEYLLIELDKEGKPVLEKVTDYYVLRKER
jgi:copper homeostasis protein (lipoprotein)